MFYNKEFQKISQIHREIPVRQSLSKAIKNLQAVRLASLLKRNLKTGVSDQLFCKIFYKIVGLE